VLKLCLPIRTDPSSLQRVPLFSHRCGDAEACFPSGLFFASQVSRGLTNEAQIEINTFVQRLGRIWALGREGFVDVSQINGRLSGGSRSGREFRSGLAVSRLKEASGLLSFGLFFLDTMNSPLKAGLGIVIKPIGQGESADIYSFVEFASFGEESRVTLKGCYPREHAIKIFPEYRGNLGKFSEMEFRNLRTSLGHLWIRPFLVGLLDNVH